VRVPFNRPFATGDRSLHPGAIESGNLSGDGTFTRAVRNGCQETGAGKALLTHSCTAALEMCALSSMWVRATK